jgi:hypothetical protein
MFLRQWGTPPGPALINEQFRSRPYARTRLADCHDIEVMGDLEVFGRNGWQPLTLKTRLGVETSGGTLYIPTVAEQISVLNLFGRPKDVTKANRLEQLTAG